MKDRVLPEQAAAELGINVLTLRCLMQQEKLPIGYAIKRDGAKRWAYFIYRKKLDELKKELGIGGITTNEGYSKVV